MNIQDRAASNSTPPESNQIRPSPVERHGGQILVDQLIAQGADTVYCVPGESYLAALDGLHDRDVNVVVCRQEGGAAMMAEAYGKATGKPGICFVTRGPGATNASSGVHVAQQDSSPMILLIGMPASTTTDRDAFQEFDVTTVFGSLGKWAEVIPSADRIPEYVSRAYHMALSGRPGPVALGLPEDMLTQIVAVEDAAAANIAAPAPAPTDMERLEQLIKAAQKPLIMVGGSGWSQTVQSDIQKFAERMDLPITCAFRFQDYIDNNHPNYVGHAGIGKIPSLLNMIRETDLLIAIGARLGEMTMDGYSLVDIPNPKQQLVHIHPDPNELGQVYRADLPIASTAANFARAATLLPEAKSSARATWTKTGRDAFEASLEPVATVGNVRLEHIIHSLNDALPDDTVITNGAGNAMSFVHRYYTFPGFRTALAPTAGAMGYAIPAAIAAKTVWPERTVVAFSGDGDFLMTGQELATAAQYGLDLTIIICNNSMYGTIRMHQEREYPERVVATSLTNPDFAAYAKSFGAFGEVVNDTIEFLPTLRRALAFEGPSVIELKLDPNAITPLMTLEEVRENAKRKQSAGQKR